MLLHSLMTEDLTGSLLRGARAFKAWRYSIRLSDAARRREPAAITPEAMRKKTHGSIARDENGDRGVNLRHPPRTADDLHAEPDARLPKQTMHIFRNLRAGFDGLSLAGKQRRRSPYQGALALAENDPAPSVTVFLARNSLYPETVE